MNAQRKTMKESLIKMRDELEKDLNNMERDVTGPSPLVYSNKCGQITMLKLILKRFYNIDDD